MNFPGFTKIFIKGFALALLVLALDQISKFYLLKHFSLTPENIYILPFFSIVLVHNKGVSFGMGNGFMHAQMLFSVLAIFILALLLFWLYKADKIITGLALGLIIGGAAGNILDRLQFGWVVDFLDFHLGHYHWPAFNIADSAVCIGAFILIGQGFINNNQVKQ